MITLHKNIDKRTFWFLLVLCLLSLFLFLGNTLFNTRGEPREAVVALSMLNEGNWILPINNGVDLAYKPPFFHWLIATCSLLGGSVTEYTSRMPSALALTAMVMGVYAFYAKRKDNQLAVLAALLTLTNFEVHRAGVACRVDMLLACMMVLSLFLLYKWTEHNMKGIPVWAVLCLSGAFLTKGPVGAALPCLVIWIYAGLKGMGCLRSLGKVFMAGILACVLPLCWYLAAYQEGGERFLSLVYEENILRLTGKMTYESHVNPWHYNVLTIVAGFVPYTLLVVMSLFVLKYRKTTPKLSARWENVRRYFREMDNVRLFTLLGFSVIFVFYCIPKSKRSTYLLPVYPFIAYFLAEYILYLKEHHRVIIKWFCRIIAALALCLPTLFVIVRLGIIPENIFGGSHGAQNAAMLIALRDVSPGILGWTAFLLPPLAVIYYARTKHLLRGMFALILSLFFTLDGLYQPIVLNTKSDYPQAQYLAKIAPTGKIYSFRTDVVEGNPMHPFTLNFYLGDRIMPFEAAMPGEGWLVVGNDDIDTFRRRYPSYTVSLVKDFEHKSCDDHKMIKLYHFRHK